MLNVKEEIAGNGDRRNCKQKVKLLYRVLNLGFQIFVISSKPINHI